MPPQPPPAPAVSRPLWALTLHLAAAQTSQLRRGGPTKLGVSRGVSARRALSVTHPASRGLALGSSQPAPRPEPCPRPSTAAAPSVHPPCLHPEAPQVTHGHGPRVAPSLGALRVSLCPPTSQACGAGSRRGLPRSTPRRRTASGTGRPPGAAPPKPQLPRAPAVGAGSWGGAGCVGGGGMRWEQTAESGSSEEAGEAGEACPAPAQGGDQEGRPACSSAPRRRRRRRGGRSSWGDTSWERRAEAPLGLTRGLGRRCPRGLAGRSRLQTRCTRCSRRSCPQTRPAGRLWRTPSGPGAATQGVRGGVGGRGGGSPSGSPSRSSVLLVLGGSHPRGEGAREYLTSRAVPGPSGP